MLASSILAIPRGFVGWYRAFRDAMLGDMTQQIIGRERDAFFRRQPNDGGPATNGDAVELPAMSAAAMATEGIGNLLVAPESRDNGCVVHTATLSRMPRRFNSDIRHSLAATTSRQSARMASRSDADSGPEATAMREAQSARLKRLRTCISRSQAAAAREAGVSKDAWNRMENGEHKISPLALARYGAAHGIATEYVISGKLIGLPDELMRVIAAVEAREAAARDTVPTGSQVPKATELDGKTPETRIPGKAKPQGVS